MTGLREDDAALARVEVERAGERRRAGGLAVDGDGHAGRRGERDGGAGVVRADAPACKDDGERDAGDRRELHSAGAAGGRHLRSSLSGSSGAEARGAEASGIERGIDGDACGAAGEIAVAVAVAIAV